MSSTVTIHIAPMSFRVKVETDGRLSGTGVYINTYCRKFVSYEYNHIHKKYIASSIFRYYNKKTKEIYLPIYDLQDFKRFLMENGVSYIDKPIKLSDGKPVNITVHSGFKPKSEAQAKAIEYLTTAKTPLRGLNVQTGGGKSLSVSADIKVPGGWTKMGDISVGDTVTAWDGTPSTVTGVFPQGILDQYKVSFVDGRTTHASSDHLWKVYLTSSTSVKPEWTVTNTEAIMTHIGNNGKAAIPLVLPEKSPDIDLTDHGESFDYAGRIAIDTATSLPDIYLKGSEKQTESLIQAIMDHSGEQEEDGSHSVTTTSFALAHQIVYLIRSLGGIATLTTQDDKSYKIGVVVKNPKRLFRKNKHKAGTVNFDLKLDIASIEPDGKAEMQCISIDHPDKLYVTDDFIVTHNTAAFIKSAADLGVRTLIRVGGMVEQWAAAIKEYTKCTDDDIYIVQGMASVDKLLRGIDKKFKPKFIVASLRTLQGYAEDKENWSKFPDFDDFLNICKIGLVCIDEAHLNFHANYIMDLRWNSPITVPLTATFKVADPKIKEIFDLHYPQEIRFGSGVYKKYVEIRAIRYNGASPFGLPKSMFKNNKGYSQIKFEAWLLDKGRGHLSAFTKNCILPLVWSYYENRREDDERMLMLCTTRAMCDYYADIFKKEFPHRKIGIYVSGSPDEMLSTCDIILSTPGSAGTGRDIKRLRFCLNTISLRSEPTNEQILGRLRELSYSSVAPVFAYTYWGCIPSHLDHAQKREFLFMPLAKEFIQSEVF